MKKRKLLPVLFLSLGLFGGTAFAITTTDNTPTGIVDDYTNSKNGTASKVYTFTVTEDGDEYAFGNGSSSTDMTWSQWLNINSGGFNDNGWYVVTTSGGSSPAKTTYYTKYSQNNPKGCSNGNINTDVAYTGGSITTPTLECTGYTFNGWYTAASGGTKVVAGSTAYTVTNNQQLYAQWTANELTFSDQTYELNWDSAAQTKAITGATNGTGSYTYSLTTAVSGFSINSSNGTITIAANKEGGVYKLSVKALDNNSAKSKTITVTIRIKPQLTSDSYNLAWGDDKLDVYLLGLKSGATASSSQATSMILGSNSFVTVLKNKFTVNTTFSFSVVIDGYTWNYSVSLVKEDKTLSTTNPSVTFNNAQQTPAFYIEDSNYPGQSNYFTWKVCKEGVTTCTDTSQKDAGVYDIIINTKSTTEKPIKIYDDNGNKTSGPVTRKFYINPFELTTSNTTVKLNNSSVTYKGTTFEPDTTVTTTINGTKVTLVNGTDYVVSSSTSLLNAGTYKLSIVGIGNYTGKLSEVVTMTINAANANNLTYDWTKSMYWTGSELKPPVQVSYNNSYLVENTDYTLVYSNNTNVGTGTITVAGKGNYTGTKTLSFSIVANEFSITEKSGYALYDGKATNGGAEVKVNNCANATIKYGTASGTYNSTAIPTYTNVGKYTIYYQVSATGFNTKTGSILIEIAKAKDTLVLNKTDVSLTMPTAQTVTVTENKSESGTTCSVTEGSTVVSATVNNKTITLTPKTSGTAKVTCTTKANTNYDAASSIIYVTVKNGTIKATGTDTTVTYDGNKHTIGLTVDPSDAKVTYSWEENGSVKTSNTKPEFINAGSYLISYSITKDYYDAYYGTNKLVINAKTLTDSMVTLGTTQYTFDGSAKTPTVTIKDGTKTLVNGTDYQVTYSNNVSPSSSATVIVSGIGNYKGEVKKTFIIKAASITYEKTNGLTEFTGYGTYGKDPSATGCTSTTCAKANVKVTAPESSYEIAYSSTSPTCQDGSTTCSAENKNYANGNTMPRFTNVGTHTVYFRIMATGYTTIEDTLTITITKRYFETPVLFGDYLYTGQIQSPSWLNYNSHFMKMTGDLQATNAGTYSVKFSLTDKNNTAWKDGTTTDKILTWTIQKISIKDHEVVIDNTIAYNEVKQPYVSEGRVTFDRTGYTQIAWVESCEDVANGDLYDRKCDYSKYTMIKDNLTNYDNENDCKNNGGTWVANTNSCQKKRLNYYDTGSSFSGMYVADYLEYDTSKTYDLYAVWSKVTYKLEYDLCDSKGCGTESGNPTIVSYDSAFQVTNPTRVGYLFMGWEISEMDETPHVIGEDTTTEKSYTVPEEWIGTTQAEKIGKTVSMKNLTSVEGSTVKLKAIWQPIKYNIIFNLNKTTYKDDDGNVTQANTTGYTPNMLNIAYDTTVALNENKFAMEGYTFAGWSTTVDNKKVGTNTACTVYTSDVNASDILSSGGCLSFTNKQNVQNLTVIEGDTINLYAQWTRNNTTKFTVTYWKQNIGAGIEHNTTNYSKVGVETYEGTSDALITLTPYTYKGTNTSTNTGGYIVNTSTGTGNKTHASIISKSGTTPIWKSTTNTSLYDDLFRGFTLQGTDSDHYNTYKQVSCTNLNETNAACNNYNTSHSFILNPNGTLNINVYYIRNTYTITYYMQGGTYTGTDRTVNSQPATRRQYQVAVTFQNPQSGSLKNGTNDNGGTDNSGKADFAGWFTDKNVTVNVYGENGEVTNNAEIFAKWLQYRYSGANNNEPSWTSWGNSNE